VRQYSQTAFPDHECGACGKHHWGVVKFYASDYSDHRKVGCMACHASDVYHPDDTTTNLFDERVPGRLAHVRLQKAWADEQGIFMVMHGEGSGYRCIVKGCDNRDVQAHHYAHKAALGQRAEAFGTVPLCREHHDELHNGVRLHIARGGQL
jgi:hypothetical protein